ncbi:MAG: tRNA pseudouridine(55) synthase TruB [Bdellovibrionota bacterium]
MSRQISGALLVNKHRDITSFGIIEAIRKSFTKKFPKMGHGGTLDPFATGLLIVCCGDAVKLARYFLGSDKSYEGMIKFGETTVTGDPTVPASETSDKLPASIEEIRETAIKLTMQPYIQIPPMYSAKKKNGKPLYELARAGIEVEREEKICFIRKFDIQAYDKPRARFSLACGSGTYVRTLAQDLGRLLGSVALLENLHRVSSGPFDVSDSWSTEQIAEAMAQSKCFDEMPCWVPFDSLLKGYPHAIATAEEANDLFHGRQHALFNILRRAEFNEESDPNDQTAKSRVAVYCESKLVAVACQNGKTWQLERVFNREV